MATVVTTTGWPTVRKHLIANNTEYVLTVHPHRMAKTYEVDLLLGHTHTLPNMVTASPFDTGLSVSGIY